MVTFIVGAIFVKVFGENSLSDLTWKMTLILSLAIGCDGFLGFSLISAF
jgi:hypothetical protein